MNCAYVYLHGACFVEQTRWFQPTVPERVEASWMLMVDVSRSDGLSLSHSQLLVRALLTQ